MLIEGDELDSTGSAVSDTRPHSFAPAEMVTCDECLRANPPTRSKCLYCGANLAAPGHYQEVSTASAPIAEADPAVTATDACYVVLMPTQTSVLTEPSLAEVATLLHLSTDKVKGALSLGHSLPLARGSTTDSTMMLADRLRTLGVALETLREDTLQLDMAIRKIRALEFSDHDIALTPVNGAPISVLWDDLILMVLGRLLVNRVEVEERKRRGRAQPLATRELFSDEPVVHLYTRADEDGWRISSSSFDFSCLGTEKAMTAFENFTTLVSQLRERAPKIELDDSYRDLRAVLANVWPLEPQTRKGEWRRTGAGKVDVATVTTTDNEAQFNYYSRLRYRLKLRELEGRP
jgi:hypothetical protein